MTTTRETTKRSNSSTTTKYILDSFSCDAENESNSESRCIIRQDSTDDFDWTRQALETPSGRQHQRRINGGKYPVTGPESALSGNFYLFIESSGRRDRDKARLKLRGPDFTEVSDDQCLRFGYNMNGYHAGRLTVYKRVAGGPRQSVWSLAGDHGFRWHYAAVYVQMKRVTELGFEGETDGYFSGDIAIDDISIKHGRCQQQPDEYLMRCDFEINDGTSTMCNLQQLHNDDFDFTLWTGRTPSDETGPNNAYNGRYYIYAEASKPRRKGDVAKISLPSLQYNGRVCLQFHYHMYGFHTGRLDVFVLREKNSDTSLEWSIQGEQGNRWLQKSVSIDITTNDKIGFRVIRADEFSGDISLDSIFVRRRSC